MLKYLLLLIILLPSVSALNAFVDGNLLIIDGEGQEYDEEISIYYKGEPAELAGSVNFGCGKCSGINNFDLTEFDLALDKDYYFYVCDYEDKTNCKRFEFDFGQIAGESCDKDGDCILGLHCVGPGPNYGCCEPDEECYFNGECYDVGEFTSNKGYVCSEPNKFQTCEDYCTGRGMQCVDGKCEEIMLEKPSSTTSIKEEIEEVRNCEERGGFCSSVIINPRDGGTPMGGICQTDKKYCILCLPGYEKDIKEDKCVMIQSFTLKEGQVEPIKGEVGTFFNIYIEIPKKYDFSEVWTTLSYNKKELPMGLILFDDGNHKDREANDNNYGATFDSTHMKVGEYILNIYATERFSNKIYHSIDSFSFSILSELECIPILNNGDPSEKIDVVFVGDNFRSLGDFEQAVNLQIDLDGENKGIFSVEPFKSNIDKFNIYRIDELVNFNCRSVRGLGNCERTEEIVSIGANCPFDLLNTISTNNFRSNAMLVTSSLVSVGDNFESWRRAATTSTHEFGHSFGNLADEYVEYVTDNYNYRDWSLGNCYGERIQLDYDCGASCFIGDGCLAGCENDPDCLIILGFNEQGPFKLNCIPPNPKCYWATCNAGDACMIGCTPIDPDCGAGADNLNIDKNYIIKKRGTKITCNAGDACMIGCTPIDPDCGDGKSCNAGDGCKAGCFISTTKESCNINSQWKDLTGNGCGQDGIIDCTRDDEKYELEINCNEGCNRIFFNIFRPSFDSIMRSYHVPFSFAPVNERLICRRIRDWTGKVEGHCTTLCIDGCIDGQKCINGECQ